MSELTEKLQEQHETIQEQAKRIEELEKANKNLLLYGVSVNPYETKANIVEQIIGLLKGTSLEGCCESDVDDNPWVGYDFDSCDSDKQWDYLCDISDQLREVGLQFNDPQLEHDCLSGNIIRRNEDE